MPFGTAQEGSRKGRIQKCLVGQSLCSFPTTYAPAETSIRGQKRRTKPKIRANSTKEFSEQFEGVVGHYPVKQGFEANRTRKFTQTFGKSLSHSFFVVPFLSPKVFEGSSVFSKSLPGERLDAQIASDFKSNPLAISNRSDSNHCDLSCEISTLVSTDLEAIWLRFQIAAIRIAVWASKTIRSKTRTPKQKKKTRTAPKNFLNNSRGLPVNTH